MEAKPLTAAPSKRLTTASFMPGPAALTPIRTHPLTALSLELLSKGILPVALLLLLLLLSLLLLLAAAAATATAPATATVTATAAASGAASAATNATAEVMINICTVILISKFACNTGVPVNQPLSNALSGQRIQRLFNHALLKSQPLSEDVLLGLRADGLGNQIPLCRGEIGYVQEFGRNILRDNVGGV